MMNGRGKSDSAIVAERPTNKAGQPAGEPEERRAETEGNAVQQSTRRAQNRESVSQALDRIRQAARQRRKEKFTALLHHISPEHLEAAFFELKENAAPGVDGLTWRAYEEGLEDKIVQRATIGVLNAIYEEDFLGFSYGFRPKRGQHNALDALVVGITSRRVNFILDADVASFFDSVSKDWLVRFVEHRIGDLRIIRLIQKWLKAGVLENGVVTVSEKGTGQGSVISPLLANVYLHYVFDLWAARWRRHEATGDMILMRYADDIVVGFEHEADARRFWDDMRKRFEEFSLSLNPDKTRLIEFGRFAAERRAHRGLGKPETFNFLGFTFICERNSRGQFLVKRITRRDRMQVTLRKIKEELRRRMHQPIPEQGAWLKQVVRGFFAYHAVPTNGPALGAFYYHVARIWLRTLRRRGQKDRFSWQRMQRLAADWLPQPRILHPYPDKRFAVMHPRQEPCAGIPPARIWAGGGQQ